jgi:Fe-S-cluster containining protein
MPAAPQPVVIANVELTVNGKRVAMQIRVPAGKVRPAELLPMYRGLSERLTALAVRDAEAAGHRITCKKGCGACCRQLVPISALEARELVKLVERMPEPRRSEIKARFAAARRRLESELPDLMPQLLHPQDFPPAAVRGLEERYFPLGIACPFLEDESCSIHGDRPIACREYLVVTPVEYCAGSDGTKVRAVTPPGGPIYAGIAASERTPGGNRVGWVHLVLAPDFVAEHPQEPPPRAGPELVSELFTRLGKGGKS